MAAQQGWIGGGSGKTTSVTLPDGSPAVLFTPSGLLKKHSANLVIKAENVARSTEVPIEASTLL